VARIGSIPKSGLRLRWELRELDAERRFEVGAMETLEPAACISGQVLRGLKKPHDCPAFGAACTPEHPSAPPWCRPRAPAPRIRVRAHRATVTP
jgi:hydrogenase expression/formation protein HypD